MRILLCTSARRAIHSRFVILRPIVYHLAENRETGIKGLINVGLRLVTPGTSELRNRNLKEDKYGK